jgi:hypothetical protein
MTKTAKSRQKVQMPSSIKRKLMAALSMLLVSSIMLVSSTYAWFTLSTAPEVTGITTNVGSNGNLEMMLLNSESFASTATNLGVESNVGDSMETANKNVTESNVTWGNLVDLSDSSYGLSSITLMPATLNITGVTSNDDNTTKSATVNEYILMAPSYGKDGRVESVDTATTSGLYASTSTSWNAASTTAAAAGVRALGTSSSVTVRLSTYRTALSSMNSAITSAQTTAQKSLQNNAQSIADTMMKAASGGDVTYTDADKKTAQQIITDVKAANAYVKTAITEAVVAYALSADNTNELTDAEVTELATTIRAVTDLSGLATAAGVTISDTSDIAIAMSTYNATESLLTEAQEKLDSGDISGAYNTLVDRSNMTVCGYPAQKVYINLILKHIQDDGTINAKIVMYKGSGVYYNIASVCGTYTVSGKASVSYGSMTFENAPFTMTQSLATMPSYTMVDKDDNNIYTEVTVSTTNQTTYNANLVTAKQSMTQPSTTTSTSADQTVAITETYGYALDLGFRTNAASSNLLLQTAGIQRVYNSDDGTASTATSTLGGGSYMEFKTLNSKTYSVDEMLGLMSAIRVAFLQPTIDDKGAVEYTLLALGALDITSSNSTGVTKYSVAAENGTTTTDTAQVSLSLHNYTATQDGNNYKIELGTKLDDESAITALTQNVASKITVVVYLDGDLVDNTMVANANQSMSGTLNLQFSSSASLQAMENTTMRNGGTTAANTATAVTYSQVATYGGSVTIDTYTLTVKEGYVIYKGSDNNYYYKTTDGTEYVKITTSNMNDNVAFSVSNSAS